MGGNGLAGLEARMRFLSPGQGDAMGRSARDARSRGRYLAWVEGLESRRLLSQGTWPPYISTSELKALLRDPTGTPAVRPNTPVLPFGSPAKRATYIDPTAHIINGYAVIISTPDFIAPYATLNAHGGIIKIGGVSAILDNASIVANPLHPHTAPAPEVIIGEHVLISYGAQVLGPSTISTFTATTPTEIGPGAVVDNAMIEPGSIVSALARVGPGVTLPTGFRVLPGMNVTTNAEASNPALGKVVKVTTADLNDVTSNLANSLSLAAGYITLYQGQSATGVSQGVESSVTGVYNGNLATIEGAGSQPGSPTASTAFLPPGTGPAFPSPHQGLVPGLLYGFRQSDRCNQVPLPRRRALPTTWGEATPSAPIRVSPSRLARSARPVTESRSIRRWVGSSPSGRTSWQETGRRS